MEYNILVYIYINLNVIPNKVNQIKQVNNFLADVCIYEIAIQHSWLLNWMLHQY